jgi:hypothetical protein
VSAGHGAISLIELYLRLYKRLGRDAYKKGLSTLVRRFFFSSPSGYASILKDSFPWGPPSTEETVTEESSLSFEAALLKAQTAPLLIEEGYGLKGLEEYANHLLPWVFLNLRPMSGGLSGVGGIVDRLGDPRLRFRGLELSLTLLRLAEHLGRSAPGGIVEQLVPRLLAFVLQQPIGTAWLTAGEGKDKTVGPVDSRVLVQEIDALVSLQARFPAALDPLEGSA